MPICMGFHQLSQSRTQFFDSRIRRDRAPRAACLHALTVDTLVTTHGNAQERHAIAEGSHNCAESGVRDHDRGMGENGLMIDIGSDDRPPPTVIGESPMARRVSLVVARSRSSHIEPSPPSRLTWYHRPTQRSQSARSLLSRPLGHPIPDDPAARLLWSSG